MLRRLESLSVASDVDAVAVSTAAALLCVEDEGCGSGSKHMIHWSGSDMMPIVMTDATN
jgi:hypothetical protein